MIRVKSGVVFKAFPEAIWRLFPVLDQLSRELKVDLYITSANDSTHKDGSLHYKDLALDLRIWNLTAKQRVAVLDRLSPLAGYDTVLEKDHIHVEWDPKEGENVWP